MKTFIKLFIILLTLSSNSLSFGSDQQTKDQNSVRALATLVLTDWLDSIGSAEEKVKLVSSLFPKTEGRTIDFEAMGGGALFARVFIKKDASYEELLSDFKKASPDLYEDPSIGSIDFFDQNEIPLPEEGLVSPDLKIVSILISSIEKERTLGLRAQGFIGVENQYTERIERDKNGVITEISTSTPPYKPYPIATELGSCFTLQKLALIRNNRKGKIPTELGRLFRLRSLKVSYNSLSGRIPTELGKLAKLQELYLVENSLTGPIPTELGRLKFLKNLVLHHNKLTGPIPTEVGKLENLGILCLSYNPLTGSVPSEFTNLNTFCLRLIETQINPKSVLPGMERLKIKFEEP